jgi:tungstate transport system permease protein
VAETSLLAVAALSLAVSGSATLLAALVGVPAGTWLGARGFRGQRVLQTLLHSLYGLPPVLLGLLLYLALSRSGPLGGLIAWVYSPNSIHQFILFLLILQACLLYAGIQAEHGLFDDVIVRRHIQPLCLCLCLHENKPPDP